MEENLAIRQSRKVANLNSANIKPCRAGRMGLPKYSTGYIMHCYQYFNKGRYQSGYKDRIVSLRTVKRLEKLDEEVKLLWLMAKYGLCTFQRM